MMSNSPQNLMSFFSDTLFSFRGCFSRKATFVWFVIVMIGFIIRMDWLGVTSFVRWLDLNRNGYFLLLHFFHSSGWCLETLLLQWQYFCLEQKEGEVINGRNVVIADHCLVPKEGTKMPGVVTQHQHSETSSKPSYFRGHTWVFLNLLLSIKEKVFAVPLSGRLDQGFESLGEKDNSTMATRIVKRSIHISSTLNRPFYLILDAFFAIGPVFLAASTRCHDTLKTPWVHIITRAKRSLVAYELLKPPRERKRGRPRKFGQSYKLYEKYKNCRKGFKKAECWVYDKKEPVMYLPLILFWKPVQDSLLFVVAETSRGLIVLMSSDIKLNPLTVIELYSRRTSIETFFSVLKNVFGGLCYHFWSKHLNAQQRRPSKNSSIHTPSPEIIKKVQKTWQAIERFVNLCALTIGLCQIISLRFHREIWQKNTLWLRTYNNVIPSEYITKNNLAKCFLLNLSKINRTAIFKIIQSKYKQPNFMKTNSYAKE